jgi:hypothetical protein
MQSLRMWLLVALAAFGLLTRTATADHLIMESFADDNCTQPLLRGSTWPTDVCQMLDFENRKSLPSPFARVTCKSDVIEIASCDSICERCTVTSTKPVQQCQHRSKWYCSKTLPQSWGPSVAFMPRYVRRFHVLIQTKLIENSIWRVVWR